MGNEENENAAVLVLLGRRLVLLNLIERADRAVDDRSGDCMGVQC